MAERLASKLVILERVVDTCSDQSPAHVAASRTGIPLGRHSTLPLFGLFGVRLVMPTFIKLGSAHGSSVL